MGSTYVTLILRNQNLFKQLLTSKSRGCVNVTIVNRGCPSRCLSSLTHGHVKCSVLGCNQGKSFTTWSKLRSKIDTDASKPISGVLFNDKLTGVTLSKEEQAKMNINEMASESEEERKKRESSWRVMKYTFLFFGVLIGSSFLYVVVEWGAPKRDESGELIVDEFSGLPTVQQHLNRAWNEIKNYNKMIKDPSRSKLLPDPLTEPYYQPPLTLVLEMTDILVHPDWTYETGWRFKKRPGVDFFLQQVGPPHFEIVIYTAEQGLTAFPILDTLDPNGYIMYRLFRDSTRYVDGVHKKDLNCLNRELSKVIMVDWNQEATSLNPQNTLLLKKWDGSDNDRALIDLALMLKTIATSGVTDVRDVIQFYMSFPDPIEAYRENQRRLQLELEIEQQMQEEKQKNVPIARQWSPSFLRKTI